MDEKTFLNNLSNEDLLARYTEKCLEREEFYRLYQVYEKKAMYKSANMQLVKMKSRESEIPVLRQEILKRMLLYEKNQNNLQSLEHWQKSLVSNSSDD